MIDIIYLFLITLVPALELRASIPYGIGILGIPWLSVFLICVLSNIILAFLVWFFVKYILQFLLKIKFINKLYQKQVLKTQKKIQPCIKKYGKWGLVIFIGIPLPGSGVYTAGLAAYLLGFKMKNYIIASIIGIIIAGIIVTIVTVMGVESLKLFVKF